MSKVTCIDVSGWQRDVDYDKVKSAGIEAVIIRAGYGRFASQKDKMFESHYKNAKAAGLKIGAYWYSYADTVAAAKKEAAACLNCIDGKTFDLPIYYDLEEGAIGKNAGKKVMTEIANAFCETIKEEGYKPGVYANLNWFTNYLDYNTLKNRYSIWLAQYNTENQLDCDIWQNSSTGNIPGVNGNCDTDVIFNRNILDSKKSIDEIAKEVIAGKWGNGTVRKSRLKKAGYDPVAVQKRVNELSASKTAVEPAKKSIDEIAKEVIAGKWGNGTVRKSRLKKAGYDPVAVQKRVNELSSKVH